MTQGEGIGPDEQQQRPGPRCKTRLCGFFFKGGGRCERGEWCTFLHQFGDVMRPERIPQLPKGKKHRTVCRYFKKGDCRLGDQCTYIHNERPA